MIKGDICSGLHLGPGSGFGRAHRCFLENEADQHALREPVSGILLESVEANAPVSNCVLLCRYKLCILQ